MYIPGKRGEECVVTVTGGRRGRKGRRKKKRQGDKETMRRERHHLMNSTPFVNDLYIDDL